MRGIETSDRMIVRPADAGRGSAAPPRAADERAIANRCRNCGADAPWNYCPNCGQETALALPSAFAFLRDAAGRYVRFDGRMWRSLHALLFRPGFLTREYLAGRRRRYVRPARLFVALSIVLFAVLRFAAGTPTIVGAGQSDAAHQPSAAPKVSGTSRLGFDVDSDLNLTIDAGAPPWLAPLRARVRAFNRLSREEKTNQIVSGMFRHAPYAAIGLLPLFALLLGTVYVAGGKRYPSRPRRYAAHLVFGAHLHAFAFVMATLFAVVPYTPLRMLLVVWSLLYGLLSLRAVYGGSWLGVVLRASAIAFAYSLFFALAVAALIVSAITLR